VGADDSLKAAIELARQVDDEELPTVDFNGVEVSRPRSRVELVDDAIACIESGSVPSARSGVLDILSEWLLNAVLVGDLGAVEDAQVQLARLAASVERRQLAGRDDRSEALAEFRGATSALSWCARLAAEALVGPALIDADTHAGRMLALIEAAPGISNKGLALRLGTEKTQVSRSGRKLLDAGLAAVSRTGVMNYWRVTAKGAAVLARRAESPQGSSRQPAASDRPAYGEAYGRPGSKVRAFDWNSRAAKAAPAKRVAAATLLKKLGVNPVSGRPMVVKEGRFGPYVTDGQTHASLCRDDSVDSLTDERAAELLADRRARGAAKKAPAKKAAAKKAAARKMPATKAPAKRAPAKKA
jgi:DNA-binding MarR family transcriptional regulator